MTKGRIAKYVANTALLAVLAAAGIGVYQLGTSGKDESVPEKVPSYYDESLSTENTTDNAVDAGTSLVEAELDSNISTDHTSEKGMSQEVKPRKQDLHQPKVHLRQKVYFRQNRVQMRMGQ